MWEMDKVKEFVIGTIASLSLEADEWLDVLKLSASRPGLSRIRKVAIPNVTHLSTIEKILLECRVADRLLNGYMELVQRDELISVEEGEQLGLDTTVKLFHIRLQITAGPSIWKRRHSCCSKLEGTIRIVFEGELKAAEYVDTTNLRHVCTYFVLVLHQISMYIITVVLETYHRPRLLTIRLFMYRSKFSVLDPSATRTALSEYDD